VTSLTINGRQLEARDGQTILEVAHEHGFGIPTLCHLDGLSDIASCRVCLVEIGGQSRPAPACATPVRDGMAVTTDSPALLSARRAQVELMLAARHHVCAVCVANGYCELQALAASLGIDHLPLSAAGGTYPLDASHPPFVADPNRCVMCLRCVRVCNEVEGAHARGITGRGCDARITIDLDQPWGESETCTNCGKCVRVCPTGALFDRSRPIAEAKDRGFVQRLLQHRGRGRGDHL
jgi:bidirectional [NiFe] hydrogenase diaphorase subunit